MFEYNKIPSKLFSIMLIWFYKYNMIFPKFFLNTLIKNTNLFNENRRCLSMWNGTNDQTIFLFYIKQDIIMKIKALSINKNKTKHPTCTSNNSHRSATANKARHCLKWGGMGNKTNRNIIKFWQCTKRCTRRPFSEHYSLSGMLMILIKIQTLYIKTK